MKDAVEAEADQFGLILLMWVDDRPPVANFSSIRRRDTYPSFQDCSGWLRQVLLLCVILRESWVPKAFPGTSFWVTLWLSLRRLPAAEHLDRGHLEMNLTLSAWTADTGTDPSQSREGPELRKKKSHYFCPWAKPTCASEKYTCCCVWCASLHALNCSEHGLTCHHLVNELTIS